MFRALSIGLFAAGLGLSATAYAQTTPAAPAAPARAATAQPASDATTITVNVGQLLTIAGGAVVGAILLDVVLPTRIAYIFGGVAGGALANAWYTQNGK